MSLSFVLIYPMLKLIPSLAVEAKRVLIQPSKNAFELLTRLHDAGFIAAVASGKEEPGEYPWILEANAARFKLQDTKSGKSCDLDSTDAVLSKLGGKRAR